jgi:hypothetical protein
LESESDVRKEQHAADYQAFKDAHAQRGASLLQRTLTGIPLPSGTLVRAAELVAQHEQPGGDRERVLVADADALSFFSLNSAGFLDYYGRDHTRMKIAWTLARLSPRGAARLPQIGLRADLRVLMESAAHDQLGENA